MVTPTQETYYEDILAHLYKVESEVRSAITAVVEVEEKGGKYKDTEKAKLVGTVKAFAGHPAGCSVCLNYQGNPRPRT